MQEKFNTDVTNSCDISIMLISLLFYFRVTKTCHNTCVWSLDNHSLTGEAAGKMKHPWAWWFLNQQKFQTTASSEWGFFGKWMQKVINGISGVHPQMYEKYMQKGKQCEYRPREGSGTARTLISVSTPSVFGYLCQIQGNGILHTLLMKREHCICGFTLASLLPSPLPCTFFC